MIWCVFMHIQQPTRRRIPAVIITSVFESQLQVQWIGINETIKTFIQCHLRNDDNYDAELCCFLSFFILYSKLWKKMFWSQISSRTTRKDPCSAAPSCSLVNNSLEFSYLLVWRVLCIISSSLLLTDKLGLGYALHLPGTAMAAWHLRLIVCQDHGRRW